MNGLKAVLPLVLLLSCFAVLMSCDHENKDVPAIGDYVFFPEPPVEIMSNIDKESSDKDCAMLNWFNIIKIKDNLYYMWYAALGTSSGSTDIEQGLFFAYSCDAIHWKRNMPDGSDNTIVSKGIQEQFIFKTNHDQGTPFRMIANIIEDGKYKLCMWKSTDGYSFNMNNRKVLLDDLLHDTQNVIIEKSGKWMLYTRLWNKTNTNRRNGICTLDYSGNILSPIDTLAGDYLYNSAATYINNSSDLLLSTFMNNKEGENPNDSTYIKCYIRKDSNIRQVDTNFNQWIKEDEKWVSFAPGFIEIDGDKYLSYMTCTWSHDSKRPSNGVSRYYLIKVVITIDE